ncbi:MAG: efflux RND transporter permease subunit [Candidatus Cloacimonetes bacterium]|nr:efflux RND transporter permease subunit [Candidatus Cloacimonadota bacterium]
MFLAKLSVKRPLMITMMILVFVVFGGLAYFTLPLNLTPDISLPFVSIQTVYSGAGPEEIELQVTKRIEDAVSTISHIDYIESYSMDNFSFVMISFASGKNVDIANQEVKDAVDAIINTLPANAERPIVGKFDINAQPVVRMVLSGVQSGTELYEYADVNLRDRFSQIPGVARVNISGGQERQIQVILSERTVFSNNISFSQWASLLAAKNMNLPGGSFTVGNQDISVQMRGEINDLNTLRNLEIATQFGTRRLSQIADVVDSYAEVRERTTFFDLNNRIRHENVVSIELVPAADGNPVQISRGLHRQLRSVRSLLPEGMELTIIDDNSIFIEGAVNDTMSNIYMGILLTGLVLLIFLYDIRSTFIVAISIPVAMISTFLMMQIAGFSLNMMSLMGLSTSVGVLVANSVVVLENIFRHKQMGKDRKESASVGTSEIAVAVIASTMTNIVVFLPIATMGGMLGQMFGEFGMTVAFATVFSLLIAFTLTPMLASLILPNKQTNNVFSRLVDGFMDKLKSGYGRMLNSVLRRKTWSMLVVLFTFCLLIFSLSLFNKIGFEFMPNMDQGVVTLNVELPIGYNLEETAETLDTIESILSRYPEIQFIQTDLGRSGGINRGQNVARSNINLVDSSERELSSEQVVDKIIRDLAHIPNAKITVSAQSMMGGGSPITLYITGLEDEALLALSNEIMEKIRDVPGLINLDTSTRSGRPELLITPRRDQLAITGATFPEVAINVRAAIEGITATHFREGGNEIDIVITKAGDAYDTPERLRGMTVVTSAGRFQLGQLANVEFSEGVNRTIRRDRSKAIQITGAPASGIPLGDVTNEIDRRIAEIHIPEGYGVRWAGSAEMMQESVVEMSRAALLAILLTFMLLVAILESFLQPLLIMSTVPLALIGIMFALFGLGMTLNIVSMMAIIMLVGIVVNNAILILDYTNQLRREEGKNVREALLIACPVKLKPILMSNLAIILGMLPMALGLGDSGQEFRQSMGIVSIGGLITSTLLTLYVIPAMYFVSTRAKKLVNVN